MNWINQTISAPEAIYFQQALSRQNQLTKPPGSLGKLEILAARLAAMQQTANPVIDRVWISVFAADHGIAEESVSAFPQSVTTEMVKNFTDGGAAINVLSRLINANLEIVDVGVLGNFSSSNVIIDKVARGTQNFLHHRAMTEDQLQVALDAGKNAVSRALKQRSDVFIGGEMGIGNTTSASAIASAILDTDPVELTGAGTGLKDQDIKRKQEIIRQALSYHQRSLHSPLSILQCLGGFEIAALTGAFLAAAQQKLPVLVDGFIASIASLVTIRIQPVAAQWFIYAHRSHERGHQRVFEALGVEPLLALDMRLGEASGAVLAVPILQAACGLHNNMATFVQAQVSKKC
jgi:nicotinate-nucleotide--dimethylbenzimidazole phosphoribosyltransferase